MAIEIEKIIDEVMQEPKAAQAIAAGGVALGTPFVRSQLLRRRPAIELEASPVISAHDAAHAQTQNALNQVRMGLERPWLIKSLWTSTTILAVLAVAGGLSYYFGWSLFSWFARGWQLAVTPGFGALVIWVGIAAMLWSFARAAWWYTLGASRAKAQLERNHKLEERRTSLAQAESHLKAIIGERIQENLFEIVNAFRAPFFARSVFLGDNPTDTTRHRKITLAFGLSEVPGEASEVPTATRTLILDRIAALPGGSLGVSGPRGVGKSTLLTSICGENLTGGTGGALTILSAAPVEYHGRDFLLHLYASLCRQVLKTEGVDDLRDTNAETEAAEWQGRETRDRLQYVARLIILAGLIMSIVGSLASLSLLQSDPASDAQSVSALDADKAHKAKEVVKTATPNQSAPSHFALALRAAGFQPGQLVVWGLAAIAIGLAISNQQILRFMVGGMGGRLYVPEAIVSRARHDLRNIRFQRSFTSGWSGGLKIPAGFEMAMHHAISLAQAPDSLPEIVENFRNLVAELVARYGRVIIAIDELDKLRSSDSAELFLNELKSIFNVHGCFYLIAVSEHALGSFERRGIGFRDAFDSALDDVVHVDYLDLAGSRALLFRRVVNLPDPALQLCHMLSGGLPRDLIRMARSLIEEVPKAIGKEGNIRQITRQLIRREVEAKVRATSLLVRTISAEPEASNLTAQMEKLLEYDKVERLSDWAVTFDMDQIEDMPESADGRRLISLREELSVYVAFLVAVDRVMQMNVTQAGWVKANQFELAASIARVRQGLETSVTLARSRLISTLASFDQAETNYGGGR